MIITIGREFGSGGRELGRRLADELKIAYYDKEILLEVEKRTPYSLSYIESVSEGTPVILPPINYGNSFLFYQNGTLDQDTNIHKTQNDILKEVAEKSSCVIIGRGADYVLKDMHPFRIFVYADMDSKIKRTRSRQKEEVQLTDKQIIKQIKSIDKKRRNFYEFYTGIEWGEKENYDMMVNTSNVDIKKTAHNLALLLKDIQADWDK